MKKTPHFGKSAWTGSPLGLWSLSLKPVNLMVLSVLLGFVLVPPAFGFGFHPGLFKPSHFVTGSFNEFPLMEEKHAYATGH